MIACLGLAYKADVDDIRESPAVKVVRLLQAEGFEVRAYDPHVRMRVVPEQVESLDAAVDRADAIVVLTDHSEFRRLGTEALNGFTGQVVVDTRNVLATEFRLRPERPVRTLGVGRIRLGSGSRPW